jgi:hypothetical protein
MQQQCNGRQDCRVIAMGDRTRAAQLTAQWAADDCRQCKSNAMGGNERWTAAAIMMDSSGMIGIDVGSGNKQQQRCNGWREGRVIAMDNEMAAT